MMCQPAYWPVTIHTTSANRLVNLWF